MVVGWYACVEGIQQLVIRLLLLAAVAESRVQRIMHIHIFCFKHHRIGAATQILWALALRASLPSSTNDSNQRE